MIAEKIIKCAAEEYQPAIRKYHRMSEVGKCERALVYDWRGEKKESIAGRGMMVFNDGDMHHRDIRDRIRKAGLELIEEERELYDKNWNLSGHIDGIICLNGDQYLLEVKSINHFQFERLDKPLEEHLEQLNLYMFYRNIPKGVILYKNKNTAALKEFIVERDDNLVQELLLKFERIDRHVRKGTFPDRLYPRDSWQCQYCQFRKVCWAGVEETLVSGEVVNVDDPAVVEAAEEYARLSQEKKDKEDKMKELKEVISDTLRRHNTKTFRAGRFLVKETTRTRESLDKQFIPDDILKKATKCSEYSCLEVKEIKS